MEPTEPPQQPARSWSSKTLAVAALASAITGGAVAKGCEGPVVPPEGAPGTSVPTPGTDVSIPEGTLPPANDPPITFPEPELPGTTTTSTTQPAPLPSIIKAGSSVTDAIRNNPRGTTFILGQGDHGNKDLTDVDGKDDTLRCDPSAKVRRFRFSNVKNLTIENCTVTPDSASIGVYILNGGGNLIFTSLTVTGGERGVLIQNDRAKPELWTNNVTIEDSTVTGMKIDAFAVYGGRAITVRRNHIVMDTDGCNVEHQDGFQSNALIDGLLEENIIENNGKKSPSIVDGGETCPPGTGDPGFQHDQGIIATTQSDGLDQNINITYKGNVIRNWQSGLPFLVDMARSSKIRIINTVIQCSLRTAPKITGSGDVTVTGSVYIPC